MKQVTTPLIIFSCIITFFSSCTELRYVYAPSASNAAGFKEKGESRVGALIGNSLTGTERAYSLQGAYAVTKHIAITASYNGTLKAQDETVYTDNAGNSTTDIVKYQRSAFEFGAGMFYPISKNRKTFCEAYAGVGFGENNISDFESSIQKGFHNSKVNRFYVQPAVSFHLSDYIFVSIPVRFISIGATSYSTNYTAATQSAYNLSSWGSRRLSLIEPHFIASLGLKSAPWVRLQITGCTSAKINGSEFYHRTNYIGAGISFDPVKSFGNKGN